MISFKAASKFLVEMAAVTLLELVFREIYCKGLNPKCPQKCLMPSFDAVQTRHTQIRAREWKFSFHTEKVQRHETRSFRAAITFAMFAYDYVYGTFICVILFLFFCVVLIWSCF